MGKRSCVSSSLHSCFVALPQVKNQHLTAPNRRRRLEWCTSMLERLGEAMRPHSGWCSCKTHISRGFHAIFHKTVLRGTVEFQPPCFPDLSPLDFLWNELETQLVQCPTPATSAELWALSTRVYHRGQAAVRCSKRLAMHGSKACVAAKRRFLEQHRTVIMRLHIVPLKDTAQTHVIYHVHSVALSTDNTCLPEMAP